MELSYLRAAQIDRDLWDQRIEAAQPALPYAFSWYLDAVATWGWDALVTPNYEWILPLPYRRRWYWVGPKRYYQPLLTQQLGIFGPTMPSADLVQVMLSAVPGAMHLSLHAGHPPLPSTGWKLKPRPNYCLALDLPYQTLFDRYHRSHRKSLRKVGSKHRVARDTLSPAEMVDIHAKMIKGKVDLKPRDYQTMQRLLEAILAQGKGETWEVYWADGQLGAMGFFLIHRQRIINLFGCSTQVGYDHRSMHVLIDAVIAHYAGRSGWLFDFEGSAIESVALFFSRFGSQEVPYWQVSHP